MTESFSQNGRIIIPPFSTYSNKNGNDYIKISFYKIDSGYTYSVQAQLQKHIYAKWPHPQDTLFTSIWECKMDAKLHLKNYCLQNHLIKKFEHLIPCITDQLDLFDNLQ